MKRTTKFLPATFAAISLGYSPFSVADITFTQQIAVGREIQYFL